jgi:hypothetical protein
MGTTEIAAGGAVGLSIVGCEVADITERNPLLKLKRSYPRDLLVAGDFGRIGICSRQGERGNQPVRNSSGSRDSVMLSLIPSFCACLRHGGVGGANRNSRRLCPSVRFAPMPCGTDTVPPARRP